MSVKMKQKTIKFKQADGTYKYANTLAEKSTAQMISEIEAKGRQTLDTIPDDYTQLSQQIDDLSESLTEIDENTPKIKTSYLAQRNLINQDTITIGKYLTRSGDADGVNQSYAVTDFEIIESGVEYTFWRWNNRRKFGIVCYYDKNKNYIADSYNTDADPLVAPTDAYYFRMSMDKAFLTLGNPIICRGLSNSGDPVYQNEYVVEIKRYVSSTELNNSINISTVSALNASERLTIRSSDSKKNNIITFSANVGNVCNIALSHGRDYANKRSAMITVNNTGVVVYADINTTVASFQHGLTIKDFINVTIIVKTFVADIYLSTNGGNYKISNVEWNGARGDVIANVIGENPVTNATLTWYVPDYEHSLWVFGDSYLDYWGRNLINNYDFKNFYFDGYGGRTSQSAYESLMIALDHYIPSKLFWALGMNDWDESGAINTSYKDVLDKVIAICHDNGIELILCTIPNTPTYSHIYKNAYVKETGLRYADVAHAVGGESANSSWYAGLLSSDNIHPTDVLGTSVITNYLMTAIPELLKMA